MYKNLSFCCRYLATGDRISSVAQSYRVSYSKALQIIKKTCEDISLTLEPKYIPESTAETWMESASGYHERWNLPHCVVALDGKDIKLRVPRNSGSLFRNYKKGFS